MSTRSVIARKKSPGLFAGTYHHWDGYPSALGHTLYDSFHEVFNKDLKKMLEYLIDEHPGGWSTINGKKLMAKDDDPDAPECYCHTKDNEVVRIFDETNASSAGCEWAYVFDEENMKMFIYSSYCEDGRKMIGAFGEGDPHAGWKLTNTISLKGKQKEHNWDKFNGY